MKLEKYQDLALSFLERMIQIRSVSFEEEKRADFIESYLTGTGLKSERIGNNILVRSRFSGGGKPTLMLNSHIDTVAPVSSYTFDPFNPPKDGEKILGLGSNDAGGSVTALLHTFLFFEENPSLLEALSVEPMLLLSCEEERSGKGGMAKVVELFQGKPAEMAIIGEPTGMKAAVAERGLLVIDAIAHGVSGHAAREEGINALYKAVDDIMTIRDLKLPKSSPIMGDVKMTVTQIEAGTAHNVVPDTCRFVIDIRPTEQYTNPDLMAILSSELSSTLTARNLTNRSSATPQGHPLMNAVGKMGIESFVSPTTSDWMRLPIPAIKMGPGESSRSHKADEFICKKEIIEGIERYINYIREI